jgi:hypothetical protein
MTIAIMFVLAVITIFSDTSFGQRLRASLSSFRLPRPTFGQIAIAIMLIVFMTVLIALLKTDGVALAARAAPDVMNCFAALDVATWLDIAALAALAALTLRLRVVWAFIRSAKCRCAAVARAIRHRRSRRAPRTRSLGSRGSDEDGERWDGAAFA